jgi:hypothetical protein
MAGFDDQRLTGAWLSQVADIGNHLATLLAEQGDDVGPMNSPASVTTRRLPWSPAMAFPPY